MDTRIYMIIDGSGSMSRDRHDVVKGVNDFVAEQRDTRAVGEDVYFSLTVFDNNVYERFIEEDIDSVPELTTNETFIGGGTALLDAIGKTVTRAVDAKATGRKIVVIYTDGAENQSQEFTRDQVKDLLEGLSKKNEWTVVYLSAELPQWDDAQAIGISPGNYMTTTGNKGSHFATASAGVASYRSSGGMSTSSLTDETAADVNWEAIALDPKEAKSTKLWTPDKKESDNDPED